MDIQFRPLTIEDNAFIFDLLTKDETSKYQSWQFETMSEIEDYMKNIRAKEDSIYYRVIEDANQNPIGVCSLTVNKKHNKGEIGYMIHPYFWGKGYATKAAQYLITYGFKNLKLNRIFAVTDTRNDGSIRVLEKVGLKREGLLRQDKIVRGAYRDSYIYSLLNVEALEKG